MIDYKTDRRSVSFFINFWIFFFKNLKIFLKKRNRFLIGLIIYHLTRPIINFILRKKKSPNFGHWGEKIGWPKMTNTRFLGTLISPSSGQNSKIFFSWNEVNNRSSQVIDYKTDQKSVSFLKNIFKFSKKKFKNFK